MSGFPHPPPWPMRPVRFAVQMAAQRGHVSDADLVAVKAAGDAEARTIEIVQHVTLGT